MESEFRDRKFLAEIIERLNNGEKGQSIADGVQKIFETMAKQGGNLFAPVADIVAFTEALNEYTAELDRHTAKIQEDTMKVRDATQSIKNVTEEFHRYSAQSGDAELERDRRECLREERREYRRKVLDGTYYPDDGKISRFIDWLQSF